MKLETMAIPEHWLCALFNGDESGFEDEDSASYASFVAAMVKAFGHCSALDVSDDSGFVRYHAGTPHGVLACTCVDVTFDATPFNPSRDAFKRAYRLARRRMLPDVVTIAGRAVIVSASGAWTPASRRWDKNKRPLPSHENHASALHGMRTARLDGNRHAWNMFRRDAIAARANKESTQ